MRDIAEKVDQHCMLQSADTLIDVIGISGIEGSPQ
jgi:hypothetical protein